MSSKSRPERPAKNLHTERAEEFPPQPDESSPPASRQVQQHNFVVEDPQNNFPVDPLSCYPVLRVIFSFLNGEDWKSCRLVSRYWKDVATAMLPTRYEVELRSEIQSPWCPPASFKLTEITLNKEKNFKEYKLDFKRANKKLEDVLLTKKLAISLTACASLSIQKDIASNFITKFGPHITKLTLKDFKNMSMSVNVFCNFLLKTLPNLNTLKCATLQFVEDSPQDPEFNPDLPHNKHNQLKRIFFEPLQFFITSQPFGVGKLRKIVKMAANLEGIHDLPLWLINEVEATEKATTLKSVSYKADPTLLFTPNGLTVLSAFEKLAHLQPQLTSWTFVPSCFQLEDGTSMKMLEPFVFSILKSSAKSLQSFEMGPTESYGFQSLPQLEGLKTLTLVQPYSTLRGRRILSESKYFSLENSLPQIFPNVSEIRIWFPLTENFINRFLPENIISPWGSQIRRLQVDSLLPGSIPLLHRRFPEIPHLEFSGSEKEIEEVLPKLAKFWSKMKTLTISVHKIDYENGFSVVGASKLDCALTGFSKEVVTQLQNQTTRENFTDAQIEGFKSQSTIGQLNELKQLTLKLTLRNSWKSTDVFTSLTQVTDEFGFKLLPNLNVTVGIRTFNRDGEVIKTPSLEPWTHFESSNVKIVDLFRTSGHC